MQLLAVITLTVIMIASWQGVIHHPEAMAASAVNATATPTNTQLPQELPVIIITPATPTPIPTIDPKADALNRKGFFSGTPYSTEEWLAIQATTTAMTNEALRLSKVTATPVVPPMDQIFTPMPTPTNWPVGVPSPTIDPADPLRFQPLHLRVMDSMNSVRFTMLPVERDRKHGEYIFKWKQGWAPPVLPPTGITRLPGANPYMIHMHFVIRPYPFDALGHVIDRYPLPGRNEIRLTDYDLPVGTWAFAVRAEFVSLDFKEKSPWSEWYIVNIER